MLQRIQYSMNKIIILALTWYIHYLSIENKPKLVIASVIMFTRITIVCPSWVGPKKNLNNFITEAATLPGCPIRRHAPKRLRIYSVNSKIGGKVLFQNWIQKSMGIEKKQHNFPALARRILSLGSGQSITCQVFNVHVARQQTYPYPVSTF